ncbi:hypothetical protein BASA81_005146 [Batrachochytrium salamandrivorans]|nr:hypothetical protein BASA81_005146 [Batrachochytrium salamandrivorans]
MSSLSILQNRMKRNPVLYKDDFHRQLAHFEALRTLLLEQATPQTSKETAKQFGKLASFLAATAPCYAKDGEEGTRVPDLLISCLVQHAAVLEPDVRMKILQAIILLRVKNIVGPEVVIQSCFGLFRVRDKPFRSAIYSYIIKDVRVVNKIRANVELNQKLQTIVFRMLSLETETPAACKRALSVVIELYKRRVWNDARAVNVVADACFSKLNRNAVAAARFFLGIDNEIDEMLAEEEEDEEEKQMLSMSGKKARTKAVQLRAKLQMTGQVSKKTNRKKRLREKTMKELKRIENGPGASAMPTSAEGKRLYAPRFPAIELIFDPQSFVERLFKHVSTSNERFEVRLIQLNLISRVVGHHKLLLFPLYSFCQKYLQPHNENINQMLACVIQACHDRVPTEVVEPLIQVLASNFVNDRSGSEVAAVGLNSVREMLVRIPLLTETDGMRDLISDLVSYRKSRDRSVVIAARTLLHELRRINPRVLSRKDWGKQVSMSDEDVDAIKPLAYGEERVSEGVDGIELLEQWLASHDGASERGSIAGDGSDGDSDDQNLDDFEEDDDDDDEDDDDEDDDDDDNKDDNDEEEPCAPVPEGHKRIRLDQTRVLSEDDFRKIRALKKLQDEGKLDLSAPGTKRDSSKPSSATKRGKIMGLVRVHQDDDNDYEESAGKSRVGDLDEDDLEGELESEDEEDESQNTRYDPSVVNPASLDGSKKKKRRELAEKLLEMKKVSDEKKLRSSARAMSNGEKAKKTKDFKMVQKSRHVRDKQRVSIHEQQKAIKGHLKTLQKKSKLMTKIRKRG